MSDNKIQTSIILDVETHKALRRAALDDGVSMNDILVMQVNRFLERRTRSRKALEPAVEPVPVPQEAADLEF